MLSILGKIFSSSQPATVKENRNIGMLEAQLVIPQAGAMVKAGNGGATAGEKANFLKVKNQMRLRISTKTKRTKIESLWYLRQRLE